MFRKITTMILIFALLSGVGSSVYAAQNNEPVPTENTDIRTMEDILNDYHNQIFDLENQTSANSRSIQTAESITQDTVNELKSAGYEAYHVNADSYAAVEETLHTDLSALGITNDGNYVIVVSGEGEDRNTGISPTSDILLPPHTEGGSGTGNFEYTYNGMTYTMRYLTISSSASNGTQVQSAYTLEPNFWLEEGVMDIAAVKLCAIADELNKEIPIGTIASLIGSWFLDENYTELDPGTLTIHAATAWTANVIQVYNNNSNSWKNAQCSAQAVSRAQCAGYEFNTNPSSPTWHAGEEYSITNKSPLYSTASKRKLNAAKAYAAGNISYDRTGDIDFFLESSDGEIIYVSSGKPLFTHIDEWVIY